MTTIGNETLVSFKEATQLFPTGNGRRINSSTVYRWAMKGIQGVKLEYVCFGRAMFTTMEALERFSSQVAAARAIPSCTVGGTKNHVPLVSQKARDKRVHVAEEDCAKHGV